MIFSLKKVIAYQSGLSRSVFNFTETKDSLISYHKAVLASQILRVIYKDLQKSIYQIKYLDNQNKLKSYLQTKKNNNTFHQTPLNRLLNPIQNQNDIQKFQQLQQRKSSLKVSQGEDLNSSGNKIMVDKESTPLREEIISLIKAYPQPQYQQKIFQQSPQKKAKRILLSYFIEGVWVHTDYCSQSRFLQPSIDFKDIMNSNEFIDESHFPSHQKDQYKKLIFCPTHLATGQVFKFLKRDQDRILLTGHFGIGKTYSFILYCLLSDMIFRYKYNYCQNQTLLPKQISFKIPKLVYWNINIHDKIHNIQRLLKRQCYQLDKTYFKQKILIPSDQSEIFRVNYQKDLFLHQIYRNLDITIILLSDQINQIASSYRIFRIFSAAKDLKKQKYFYEQFSRLAKVSQKIKQQFIKLEDKIQQQMQKEFKISSKQVLNNLKNAQNKQIIYQKLIPQFKKVIFLSSQNIQQNLLKNLNLNGQKNHHPIKVQKINDKKQIKSLKTAADTAQFISLYFQKRIYESSDENKDLQKKSKHLNMIKNSFFKFLQKNRIFISPYTIITAFKEAEEFFQKSNKIGEKQQKERSRQILWTTIKSILKQQSQVKINQFAEIIMNQLNFSAKSTIKIQIDNFLKKTYQKQIEIARSILLYRILQQAKYRLQQGLFDQMSSNYFSVKFDDLLVGGIKSFSIEDDLQTHFNKNIFQVIDKQVHCAIDEKIVVQILDQKQRKRLLMQTLLQSDKKILNLVADGSTNGGFIKNLFKTILSTKGTNFMCFDNELEKCLQFQNMKIQKQILYFETIPQVNSNTYKNFNFLEGLKDKLKILDCGNYLFLPSKKSKNISSNDKVSIDNRNSQNIKLIDFIIVKKETENIQITAFDTTIKVGQEVYMDKIERFLQQFENFKDKNEKKISFDRHTYSVSLNYVVLCPFSPSQKKNKKIDWQKRLSDQNSSLIKQNLNSYSFHVKGRPKKNKGRAVKILLKNVSVCSILKTYLWNTENKKEIELELRLFERIQKEFLR